MSKSLRSYPLSERGKVIARRLAQSIKGLGYWAAKDAEKKVGKVVVHTTPKE
jgi:hypothetical protein